MTFFRKFLPSYSRVFSFFFQPKSLTQILSDPNIVKHLQNIQLLKQNEMENQKNTKLTEMRLQEEKFEKHLATVLKVRRILCCSNNHIYYIIIFFFLL